MSKFNNRTAPEQHYTYVSHLLYLCDFFIFHFYHLYGSVIILIDF